ncbi:MAG: hypothetical protein ACOYOE_00605 [Chlorobium sp.]
MFLMSLLTVCSAAEGKTEPPLITVMVTPDSVLVGDRIHCIINIHHSDREVATLEWHDAIDTLSSQSFKMISRKHISSTPFPGSRQERFELELAVFGAGHQPLPPVTVALRDINGRVTKKVVYTPPISVFVRALTDSSMRDLTPLKPPLKPQIPLLLIMPVILGVCGVAVLVLLLLFLLKRLVRRGAENVDSSQVAQRKLRKLGSSLSAGMPPHECYEELSNIMRSFLENHYRIRALEAVTQEIERDLKKLGIAGFENIMNLLKQADLVKFADSRPDAEESRQSLHKASEVIRSTRHSRPPEE